MVALKRRHFGVLLATLALVLSFFGLAQFVGAQAPASAAPPELPRADHECEQQGHLGLGQRSARRSHRP